MWRVKLLKFHFSVFKIFVKRVFHEFSSHFVAGHSCCVILVYLFSGREHTIILLNLKHEESDAPCCDMHTNTRVGGIAF